MIVFVCRTSEKDDSVCPFPGAKRHYGTNGWYIEMEPEQFVVWAEAYGPLVVDARTMPNGDRAWLVEIYDQLREGVKA